MVFTRNSWTQNFVFSSEFDYRGEARNLSKIHGIVTPLWGSLVRIPLPINEYCSKHILVMEYLRGVRLVDGIRNQYRHVAAHMGVTLEDLEQERKLAILSGTYKFKTLAEASQESSYIKWIETGYDLFCTLNPWKRLYNYTLPPLSSLVTLGFAPLSPFEIHERPEPLDLGALISLLFAIHGHEIFEGGHFNGDPRKSKVTVICCFRCHIILSCIQSIFLDPGNILLLEDGRLGLIDYGQVTSIGFDQRVIFAKLVIAISRDDKEEVARIFFDEMGAQTKYKDKDVAYRLCCFWADRDTDDILNGMNIADFLDDCEAKDPMISIPPDYLVAQRVSVLLRGMGNAFGLKVRTTDCWAQQAAEFLRKNDIEY